jgi:hypothetical protein
LLKNSGLLCYVHCEPIDQDQQARNFNSLTIRALPEIGLLAVESRGDGSFSTQSPLSSRSLPATAMGRNVAGLGGRLTRHDGGRRIGKNRDTPV